jgi:hypothetical protein
MPAKDADRLMALTESQRARFYARVAPCSCCECIRWGGQLNKAGYGMFSAHGRNLNAHRVGWFFVNGVPPQELELDHVKAWGCKHRDCVNVEHLEAVDHRTNLLRGDTEPAKWAPRTHCPKGHPLVEGNLVRRWPGENRRRCRECDLERQKRYYHRRRAATPVAGR